MADYEGISQRRQWFDTVFVGGVEKIAQLVVYHWLAMVNLALFVFVFMSGLAPFLMSVGLTLPAKALYMFYKLFCHDIPDRHYLIFGYRTTLDHRSLAIYGAMLGLGLIFPLVSKRLKPLNWRLYLLLILPMALDGFTQLFGLRTSNWELRNITGALFGLATAWIVYPYVERAMQDARRSSLGGSAAPLEGNLAVRPIPEEVVPRHGRSG